MSDEMARIARERDAFREELSKIMPMDYKAWWQNSKDEWPLVARLTFENIKEREDLANKESDSLRARVSELESALIRLRDCDWTISLPNRMDAVREIARDALNKKEVNHGWPFKPPRIESPTDT